MKEEEMVVQNAACSAGFMAIGMMERGDYGQLLDRWANGCYELHYELARYAEKSEWIVWFLNGVQGKDFPGVYDYEVSEHFGAWFGNYIMDEENLKAEPPDYRTCVAELIRRACTFFAQGVDDARAEELRNELIEKTTNYFKTRWML